jgi:hypothetical protein
MRAGFGLIGLLVTVGVIVAIWSVYHPTEPVRQGQQLRPQVEQLSGRGADQQAAVESFQIDPQYEGGRLQALRVTQVSTDGAMERFYGLAPGDAIVEFGAAGTLMAVRDHSDPELVKALIHDSYRAGQPIVVVRAGERVMLPQSAAPATGGNGGSALQRQLDLIQRVPTH